MKQFNCFKIIFFNEILMFKRRWTVTNGVDGETCTDWKADDNELWCTNAQIPGQKFYLIHLIVIKFYVITV